MRARDKSYWLLHCVYDDRRITFGIFPTEHAAEEYAIFFANNSMLCVSFFSVQGTTSEHPTMDVDIDIEVARGAVPAILNPDQLDDPQSPEHDVLVRYFDLKYAAHKVE